MARNVSGSLLVSIFTLAVVVLLVACAPGRLTPLAYDNLALVETLHRFGGQPGAPQLGGGTATPSEPPTASGGSHTPTFRSPWNAIKARLALGDYAGAAELALALKSQIGQDELRYLYVLMAAQKGGRDDWAVDLYETVPPPRPAAVISDTIFLSYLQRGEPDDFERALALQPNSLIAHYYLWRQAMAAGDQGDAAEHLDRLTYFPIEVFEPTSQELAEATIDLASTLAEDGVWDQERLLRTAAYLVFRQPELPAVESLITKWSARQDAHQVDWLFLLAELHHRRSELDLAQAHYLDVIERDPGYWQAAQRLASLWQARSEQVGADRREALAQAARWRRRTNELAPGDPMAMKAWAQVCSTLKQIDPAAGQSPDCVDAKPDAVDPQAEIRAAAAGLLEAPPERVQVGPNEALNGGVEEWGFRMPATWFFSNQAAWNSESNRGVVILTDDRLDAPEGSTAARFDALALEQNPGKEAARYSLVTRPGSAIRLEPGQWYAIAVTYRTEDMAGLPVTADLVDTDMSHLGIEQEQMPATDGRWARHVFLRRFDGGQPQEALLWLRGWQTGRVWFDDVSVQLVSVNSPSSRGIEGRVALR